MPTIEERPDQTGNASTSRLGTDFDELKNNAKGFLKSAVDALGIAASMTQNVPYLGVVSSALAVFLKILDEVNAVTSDWESVITDGRQIESMVDQARKECKKRVGIDTSLPEDLIEALSELEQCIMTALKTLNASGVGSQRRRDRLRVFLNRGDLAGEVKKCGRDMNAALMLFSAKMIIGMRFDVHEFRDKLVTSTAIPAATLSSVKLRPPRPGIFYGRACEVDQIVDQILHHGPARVAIMGSGGIGKTSIALTALHHPDVVKAFGDDRYFVSCEAATTAEGVILELLATLGILRDSNTQILPQQLLRMYLKELSHCVLCLDNLETPWDAETRAVEDLLGLITSFVNVVLLITTRGSHRPQQVLWTRPFLLPVAPLTLDAALQSWDVICGMHDEFSVMLVQDVDCVPLAVTLLANLAQTETSEDLWRLWEHRSLAILPDQVSKDRLSSIEFSIELSLQGPKLKDNIPALHVLQIVSMLSQGLLESRIPAFMDAYTDLLPDFEGSLVLLKRCALVYSSNDGFLRVLSPIRHYMQMHYPLSNQYLYPLAEMYCRLVDHEVPGYGAMNFPYAQVMIQPEIGNISAILMHCLTCRLDGYERKALNAVIAFSKLCQTIDYCDVRVLEHATSFAQKNFPHIGISLLEMMGSCYEFSGRIGEAISTYTQAVHVCRSLEQLWEEAWVLKRLGRAFYCRGEYDKAKHSLQLAISIYDKCHKLSSNLTYCKVDLGRVYTSLGQLEKAEGIFLSLYKGVMESDKLIMKQNCAQYLGELYLAKHQFDRAEQELLFSLKLSQAYSGILCKAMILATLGSLYTQSQDYDRAELVLRGSKALLERIGGASNVADCLRRLGELHLRLGQLGTAENYVRTAAMQHQAMPDIPREQFFLSNSLGHILYLQGRYDEARDVLKSAIRISSAMPYPLGHGEALFCLGKVLRDSDELQEALDCFSEAVKQFQRAEDPRKAESVSKELDELVARLRAMGRYTSPAITEGSTDSTRTNPSIGDEDDEE